MWEADWSALGGIAKRSVCVHGQLPWVLPACWVVLDCCADMFHMRDAAPSLHLSWERPAVRVGCVVQLRQSWSSSSDAYPHAKLRSHGHTPACRGITHIMPLPTAVGCMLLPTPALAPPAHPKAPLTSPPLPTGWWSTRETRTSMSPCWCPRCADRGWERRALSPTSPVINHHHSCSPSLSRLAMHTRATSPSHPRPQPQPEPPNLGAPSSCKHQPTRTKALVALCLVARGGGW